MSQSLEELLNRAKSVTMSASQQEAQRQSFAYGSAAIENSDVTKDIVRQAASDLAAHRTHVVRIDQAAIIRRG